MLCCNTFIGAFINDSHLSVDLCECEINVANICSNASITEYNQGGEDDMMLMYYNSEADSYQPDEDVKVKMSIVLDELKSVVQSGKNPDRGSAYHKFAHVIDSSWKQQQPRPAKSEQNSSRRKYFVLRMESAMNEKTKICVVFHH